MKIQLLSDLHVDTWGRADLGVQVAPDTDLVVVAGDLSSLARPAALQLVKQALSQLGPRVLYVPGNHEYYNQSFWEATKCLQGLNTETSAQKVVVAATPRTVDLQQVFGIATDIKVLAGTMWYDQDALLKAGVHPYGGTWFTNGTRMRWSDFWSIKDLGYDYHAASLQMRNLLLSELNSRSVVVSHFLPSKRSVPPRFKNAGTNHFFVVPPPRGLLQARRPLAWLHGHTHTATSYRLGRTAVVCNPRGYPKENDNHPYRLKTVVVE